MRLFLPQVSNLWKCSLMKLYENSVVNTCIASCTWMATGKVVPLVKQNVTASTYSSCQIILVPFARYTSSWYLCTCHWEAQETPWSVPHLSQLCQLPLFCLLYPFDWLLHWLLLITDPLCLANSQLVLFRFSTLRCCCLVSSSGWSLSIFSDLDY